MQIKGLISNFEKKLLDFFCSVFFLNWVHISVFAYRLLSSDLFLPPFARAGIRTHARELLLLEGPLIGCSTDRARATATPEKRWTKLNHLHRPILVSP